MLKYILISLLFLCHLGRVVHAQDPVDSVSSNLPFYSADDVAMVIQLKHYYDFSSEIELNQAKSDLKKLFGNYEIIYLPGIQALAVMIGATNSTILRPVFFELKKKYPRAIIRRLTTDQVKSICDNN